LGSGYFAACGHARTAVFNRSGNLAQPCDYLEITPCTAEITCSSLTWVEHNGSGGLLCGQFPALQSAPCDLIYTSSCFSPTELCVSDDGDSDDGGDNNNVSGGNSQAYPAKPLVPVDMPTGDPDRRNRVQPDPDRP
jgi:hypothetical protein